MKRLALVFFLAFCGIAGAQSTAPQVVAKIRVGTHPCAAVEANGRLWVTNFTSHTVSVVDPKRNRVLGKPIKVDSQPVDRGRRRQRLDALLRHESLARIDPHTRKVKRIRIGLGSDDVLFAAESVWGRTTPTTPSRA